MTGPFPAAVLDSVPTPCLLVDLAAAERNIARMATAVTRDGVALRPHFKAHKCVPLLRRQLAGGACSGVTCQTSWEARVLAEAGVGDILVTNQLADRAALEELATAAAEAQVTVAVDDARHVELLAELSVRRAVRLGVVVEVDVGQGRCGLPPGDERIVELAQAVQQTPGLRFRGLQGYEGHAVLLDDRAKRAELVDAAAAILAAERDRLAAAGIACELITGGGTGTFDLSARAGVLGEIQAGSYVLMDAAYSRPGMDLPFEQALYCVSTVISRTGPETGVLNAGLKELSGEYGPPLAADPGVEVTRLADEHSQVRFAPGHGAVVGDKMLLVPVHVDPTVNLHDVLHVWDGRELRVWPVDGRRRLAASPPAG